MKTSGRKSAFKTNVAQQLGLMGACNQPSCYHAPYWTVTNFSDIGNPAGQTQAPGRFRTARLEERDFPASGQRVHAARQPHHQVRLAGQSGITTRLWKPSGPPARPAFNGQWTAGAGSTGFAFADLLLGPSPRDRGQHRHLRPILPQQLSSCRGRRTTGRSTPKLTLSSGPALRVAGRSAIQVQQDRQFLSDRTEHGADHHADQRLRASPGYAQAPSGLGRGLWERQQQLRAARRIRLSARQEHGGARRLRRLLPARRRLHLDRMSIIPPFIRSGDAVLSVNQQSYQSFPLERSDAGRELHRARQQAGLYRRSMWITTCHVRAAVEFVHRSHLRQGLRGESRLRRQSRGWTAALRQFPNDPIPAPGDVQSRRPFQNIGAVTEFSFTGQSNYQGLELEGQKRYGNGLTIITSFTWSKDQDNITSRDMWFGGSWKEISALNVPKRFSFAGVYEVPFGRGRKFGSGAPAVANAILGGWQLSAHRGSSQRVPVERHQARQRRQLGRRDAGAESDRARRICRATSRARSYSSIRRRLSRRRRSRWVTSADRHHSMAPASRIWTLRSRNTSASKSAFRCNSASEFFNILNHRIGGTPAPRSAPPPSAASPPTPSRATPRTLQFGLKLLF